MGKVSVIIRTYSEARWDYLVAAVKSLEAQSRRPDQVVIVVDHNPALFAMAREAMPDCEVVLNDMEAGSSGAWNRGIQAARGDVLAFMDDDAAAAPDWLEQLLEGYRDTKVIGVGGEIVPNWVDGRPGWFPDEFTWVVGCTYKGLPETEKDVRNLIGCNMSFLRSAFETIGGFLGAESGIGHVGSAPVGCDETEFCIRVGQQLPDRVLRYRPQARVFHNVPAARTTWSYFLSRCRLEGRSKARVSRMVGRRDGLATEMAYSFKAIPEGVARGIGLSLKSGRVDGLRRAAAIVAGFSVTAWSYLVESLSSDLGPVQPSRGTAARAIGDRVV